MASSPRDVAGRLRGNGQLRHLLGKHRPSRADPWGGPLQFWRPRTAGARVRVASDLQSGQSVQTYATSDTLVAQFLPVSHAGVTPNQTIPTKPTPDGVARNLLSLGTFLAPRAPSPAEDRGFESRLALQSETQPGCPGERSRCSPRRSGARSQTAGNLFVREAVRVEGVGAADQRISGLRAGTSGVARSRCGCRCRVSESGWFNAHGKPQDLPGRSI